MPRKNIAAWSAAIVVFSSLLFNTARGDDTQSQAMPSKQWLANLRHEMEAIWPDKTANPARRSQFVAGNNIWQPGRKFADGKDWLALTCRADGCKLVGAELKVVKESWQGHYDDKPTPGQRLHFKLTEPSDAKIVAWFKTAVGSESMKPGNVPTYYSGIGHPKPTEKGTLEARVDLPDGGNATLVPLLLSSKHSPKLVTEFDPSGNSSTHFFLQLRSQGLRQLLPGEFGSCSASVPGQSYLLWAGDLDGDGKPDYLISFIDEAGPVHLYLSSRANPGQLVGLAAIYDSPPSDFECDGGDPEM